MSNLIEKRIDEIITIGRVDNNSINICPDKDILTDSGNYLKIWNNPVTISEEIREVESGNSSSENDSSWNTNKNNRNIPTKEGLAIYLGITSSMLLKISNPNNWEDPLQKQISERMSLVLEFLEDIKVNNLVNRGLNNEYNAKITEILINKSYKKTEDENKKDSGSVTNNFFFSEARKFIDNDDNIIKV